MLQETRSFTARHDLDGLVPVPGVRAEPARIEHLDGLAAIANREIPGVSATSSGLKAFLQADPMSIFAFERGQKLLGGIAFLYLNDRGHDALLLDEIDLHQPDRTFLASPGEEVSAIYTWALAGHGRAMIGLGQVAARLREPRFAAADYFAQPSTAAGRDLLVALGFRPIASYQRDLWCYARPWRIDTSRFPVETTAAGVTRYVHV